MNLVDQAKYKLWVTKYATQYAVMREELLTKELEGLKSKYQMSDLDYARLLIGIEVLTIRKMKK